MMPTHELSSAPAMLPLYAKAVGSALPVVGARRGVRHSGGELPNLELNQRGVGIDAERLTAYSEVCGFGIGEHVPATYPHVLAFPLHLALMTDGSFPFPPMGMVHLQNRIVQHRPLRADEVLDLRVCAVNLRPHAKGQQFDIVSVARVGDDLVWEDVSTYLCRGRAPAGVAEPSGLEGVEAPPSAASWHLAGDLGRRYAAVSGDRNPIHLSRLTAKAFGFPRQIAHGMWSKARCLAALTPRLPDAYEMSVALKKPILLPTTVSFGAALDGETWVFGLRGIKRGTPHLVGTATPL